jgi:hypothetical protein
LDEPKTLFITESNFRDEPSIFDLSDSVPREGAGAAFRRSKASDRRAPGRRDNNKKREKRPEPPIFAPVNRVRREIGGAVWIVNESEGSEPAWLAGPK